MQLSGSQYDVLPGLLHKRLDAGVCLIQQTQSLDEFGHLG
jgi:hypothetical protein